MAENLDVVEIEDAVCEINGELYEQTKEDDYLQLSFSTNGWCQIVEFAGIRIWDSEDNNRLVDDNEEYTENMEMCLRRNIMAVVRKVKLINV